MHVVTPYPDKFLIRDGEKTWTSTVIYMDYPEFQLTDICGKLTAFSNNEGDVKMLVSILDQIASPETQFVRVYESIGQWRRVDNHKFVREAVGVVGVIPPDGSPQIYAQLEVKDRGAFLPLDTEESYKDLSQGR